MSDCYTKTLLLSGFDRATSDNDRIIKSILTIADGLHDEGEADVLTNPVSETLRRLSPIMDAIAFRKLESKLAPIAARLERG